MLYFSSIHPDWDYFGSFQKTDQGQAIASLLESIALNHARNTGSCVSALERLGIILGNGGFEGILLQRDPLGAVAPMDRHWLRDLIQAALACLDVPLWYCFSIGCRIYILCCFPRLREDAPEDPAVKDQVLASCRRLQAQLQPAAPALRLILSDLQYGESGIFRCFNNLHHAMEYYDFRSACSSPVQLDAEQQLHGAFIGDLSVYRQFSISIAEQLSRDDCPMETVAALVCDTILSNCAPSMESIHHHIQIFMLTFTDYLGSSGLVDASYLARHQIVYRAMGFEREAEFRYLLLELLEELHRQNRTLRTIGRQKRIQTIREYVEQNITNPELTAAFISEEFHISTAQIAKQFRYYFGVSLHRFIQQTRYHYAEALLTDHPDWSVHQIAAAAGYTDLSTMYRAFRTLGNVTPGALRNALQQSSLEQT